MHRLGIVRRAGVSSAEIAGIARLGSASLREASEALVSSQAMYSPTERTQIASAISARAKAIQADLHPWDLLSIIRADAVAGLDVPAELSDVLTGKLSHLSPKHLIDLLAALDLGSARPKALYAGIMSRLVQVAQTSMLGDELVALFRVIGRNNSAYMAKLVEALCGAILTNESLRNQLRYLHCCEVIGIVADVLPDSRVIPTLLQTCSESLEVMPLEELWKTITHFPRLEFSHSQIETLAKEKLRELLESPSHTLFDQVTRPMDFFQFLRMADLLSDETLVQACKWANDAVYREATRTQAFRRPTIFEVALLADVCKQRNIPQETIQKAITVTVKSLGGTVSHIAKPKPLKYRKGRIYLREVDGYKAAGVVPITSGNTIEKTKHLTSDVAFAPALRKSGQVSLWKARSSAWYYRK